MRRWGLFLLAALMAGARPVHAETPAISTRPAPGTVVEGLVTLGDRQVPLPRGTWQVTGHSLTPAATTKGEPYGAVETVVLVQRQGTVIAAMTVITQNMVEVERGWVFDTECQRSDLLFAQTVRRGGEGTCLVVNHVVTTAAPDSPRAWLDTLETVEAEYLSAPGTWVMAGVTAANQHNLMDVRTYYNPEVRGLAPSARLAWAENDWHRHRYARDPAHKAFVEAVTAWGRWYRHYVEAGLLGRLAISEPLPQPWDNTGTGLAPEIQQRLLKLRLLRDAGVLTAAEFTRQSDLVLASAEKEDSGAASWWTSPLTKTLSYRSLALMDTGVIGYFVTGNASVSGAIAVAETVTKTGLYYGHEKLWDAIRSATTGGPNPPPAVLVGTGDDRDADSLLTRWQKVMAAHLPGSSNKSAASPSPQTAQAPPARGGFRFWWPTQWLALEWPAVAWPAVEWHVTPIGWLPWRWPEEPKNLAGEHRTR